MSDVESLLLILCAIYVSECCLWLRVDTVWFTNPWLRGWKYRFPRGVIGNDDSRLVCGNLLPPLGPAFVSQWWPISFSPQAIVAYTPQAVNSHLPPSYFQTRIAFAEITDISTRESKLLINGKRVAQLCSPQLAWSFAKFVRELESAPESARAELIDRKLERALDGRSVSRRYRFLKKRIRCLWLLCNLLFVYLVSVSALLLASTAARQYWLLWLIGLLLLVVEILWEYRTVFRSIHRRDTKLWRKHGLMMCLSPLGAIRAYDFALRYALSTYHPLALAEAFCSGESIQQLAQLVVLDHKYPLNQPGVELTDPQAETVAWFQERFGQALQTWLKRSDLRGDDLLEPPERDGNDCVSFCPRCHAQYVLPLGVCEPCRGVPLRMFKLT